MIRLSSFYSCCALSLLFFSCSSSRMQTSGVKPQEINNVLLITPVSLVSLVGKGNQGVFDKGISYQTRLNLQSSLIFYTPNIQYIHVKLDTTTYYQVYKELQNLKMNYGAKKTIAELKIPLVIESLMNTHQANYSIALYHEGFTRTKKNRNGEIAKTIAVPILTLGMIGYSSVQSFSTVDCFIFDNQRKNIAFYNTNVTNQEPVETATAHHHIRQIFEGYFLEKK